MPYTPLHGLAVLFLYFKGKSVIDPFALVAAASLVDLEPLYYFLSGSPFDHRIWHGFALVLTVFPILVGLAVYFVERLLKRRLWWVYNFLWLEPKKVRYSLLSIYFCCLFGGISHVIFDMFTHDCMPYVVYPLVFGNPFYLGPASVIVEIVVVALASYSIFCWLRSPKLGKPQFSA